MGFNKRYLPDLETLKERRKEYSSDKDFYIATVGKSDALIGPEESLDFLDSIYKKIIKEKDDNPNREHDDRGL